MADDLPAEDLQGMDMEQDFNPSAGGGGEGILASIQDFLSNPQNRLIAIGVGVVIVAVLAFAIVNSQNQDENRGDLVPLVNEIDQARAFEIVAKLKSVNIEAKVLPGEKPGEYVVSVYENAIETSYLSLSRTNLLENDDYGLFDQNDWAASDYDKRIKLTRAINGDLSRIISRMEGLRAAIVRVNIPEQQIFTDNQSPTTATVQIELANDGDELSKSQVKSIMNLLRGYVPNLDKEKISIVDTQGRNYSIFKEEDETEGGDFIDEVERFNKLYKTKVADYLNAVLGSHEYQVSVSVSLSREKVEKQETIYSDGAVGSRQTSREDLKANNNGAMGPGNERGKKYNSSSSNETMLPSFEQRKTTYLPGRIQDVSVALAVDKTVPAMISLKQLRESVAAIIGPRIKPENIKITVVDMHAGDIAPETSAAPSGLMANVQNFFNGGTWSVVSKILIVIAIIIALLIIAVISLNFLNAASNQQYEPDLDPNMANEFDQVLNDNYPENVEDFGEGRALEQQEALLQEMMNQSAGEMQAVTEESEQEQMEFDNLLNDFQTVASSKPDILAKKIQVWLDDEV